MDEWQDISTAPKDGTVIFGAWAYTGLLVRLVDDDYLPTHWMPLPEPPKD